MDGYEVLKQLDAEFNRFVAGSDAALLARRDRR